MTKKHFEAVAKAIKEQRDAYEGDHDVIAVNVLYGTERVAKALANTFEGFNPLFDRTRFLEACGLMR